MNIVLKNISKSFHKTKVIQNLNLRIDSTRFTTLLGSSGCGKTTVLRMIAGLETPDSGEIWFDDKCIFSNEKNINVAAENRKIGFVFQDFALWPHMTVFENVAYSLRARGDDRNLRERVMDALFNVRMEAFAERYPHQLSGGQQQRVAFARAMAGNPQCVLFDEPLSALDALLRDEMRREIKRLTNEKSITSVFVTHDQAEAMCMSDKIVVMNQGKIEQEGVPEEIYYHPATTFVARFIGKSNWIDEKTMFRPEAVSLHPDEDRKEFRLRVASAQFMGNAYELNLKMGGKQWTIMSPQRAEPDEKISVYIKETDIMQFSA